MTRLLDEIAFIAVSLVPAVVLLGALDPAHPLTGVAILVAPYLFISLVRISFRLHRREGGRHATTDSGKNMAHEKPASGGKPTTKGKFADLLAFVVGPVLLIMGVFSFSHDERAIEYSPGSVLLIGLGVGFIAFGLLRRQWLSELKRTNKE